MVTVDQTSVATGVCPGCGVSPGETCLPTCSIPSGPLARKALPKGKQPRRYQDRSCYGPHQGKRECARRRRQARKLDYGFDPFDLDQPYPDRPNVTEEEMAAVRALADEVKRSASPHASASKDRQDPPASGSV